LHIVFQKTVPTQEVTNPLTLPMFIACMMFSIDSRHYCLAFDTIGPNDLHPSPAPQFKTFKVFLIYFPVSKFQHHTSTILAPNAKRLVSFLSLSLFCS